MNFLDLQKPSKNGLLTYQSLSADAEYVNPTDEFEADGRSLLRNYIISPARPSKDLSLQTDLISNFKTGFIEHQIVLGLDLRRNTYNYAQLRTSNFPSLDIFNPIYGFPRPDFFENGDEYESQTDTVGIYYDTNGYLIFPQAPFTLLGTLSVNF